MPEKILIQEMDGTPPQITFADFDNDFSPTAANDLRHPSVADTECEIQLASLADGAARESDKVDLGENRTDEYHVRAAFELAATPVTGDIIELYWAPSPSSTAGNGNPAGVSGSDGAFTGYGTLSEALPQLMLIGMFVCSSDATGTVQVGEIGRFSPPERYGTLIIVNESGAAFHTDDVESHVVFDPIIPEIQ